ncbi:hypothetical protein CRG98_011335 [Punica granatum]|uniref:G-patch domain-containing protein n=1 Tax=Punica granatum TaxID=22663 RepID=A0A2I0KIA4_PUNGR|nr:hypothetical protein CRG98_011335 [Punica granatum]
MAEGDHADVSEEVNPSVPTLSQPPPTHAPPPLTPAGVLPAYSGALPTHLPPPASSGAPLPPASLTSAATDDQARIAALEGTPHADFSHQAPPPINTTFHEPGTPTHAAQFASPTHFFPEADAEQERRSKRMEETIRALQASDARPDARYGDCSLFPGMWLPPKFKDQSKHCEYHQGAPGHTLDNCWRLRDEIQRRIDSNRLTFNAVRPPNVQANPLPDHRPSSGPSINMISICVSERDEEAQEIPLPFVINYTPEEPTVGFTGHEASPAPFVIDVPAWEPYSDSKSPAAKDKGKAPAVEDGATPENSPFPSKKVTEEEAEAFMKIVKIQLFHSTLRGVYYSHLLAHTSSFSDLIEAGKKLDLGIKLGRIEDPTNKGEESSKKAPAALSSSSGRRAKEVSVNAVNTAHHAPQQYSVNLTTTPTTAPTYFPPPPHHQPQSIYYSAPPVPPPTTSQSYDHFAPSPVQPSQPRPPVLRPPPPAQQNPTSQGQQAGGTQSRPRKKYLALPAPLSHIYRQLLAGNQIQPISPAHISLLALLLGSKPHREALLRVLTAAQVPKETPPDRIEETIGSIFSNTISFSDDELPSEGWSHSRALHIVCKCNNYIIGRVMIDNGSALNVCSVTTLKQMNVDLNRVHPSKTAVRAFDGSRREVNGEIDLLIDVGPCSFSITFQVLDIPNAFSLLLGRPWIHSAGAVPSSLHQRLKFIVEEKLITVKGEEDCAIYKETAVPYISVGDDENLPFHSFETISVIRDYGESGPSRVDRMIGKVLLRNNNIPGTGLGARGQGISRPIEIEERFLQGFTSAWRGKTRSWTTGPQSRATRL